MERKWNRDGLIELARHHRLGARDANGDYAPLPPWLAEATVEEITYDLVEFVELVHPDDRNAVVELYRLAHSSPGRQVTASVRFGPRDELRLADISLINLVDDPDIGLMVAVLEESGTVVAAGFEEEASGVQQPADWMIMDVARSGVIVRVEGSSQTLLGYEPSEMVGRVPAEFVQPDELLASIQMFCDLRAEPDVTRTSRRRWVRSDGSVIWMETSYATHPDPLPGQGDMLMVMWDITAKMAAEQALRDGETNLRRMANVFEALADEVPAAVFQCRLDGTVTFHNARWGHLIEERSGIDRIHDLFADDDRSAIDRLLHDLSRMGPDEARTVELAGRTETTVWRLTVRSMAETDDQATFMGSLEDVTATARLRHRATRDPLTGLLNRAGIEAALAEALSGDALSGDAPTGDAPSATVVFFDLDRFKTVNDTWGHEAGDAVLVGVAERLQQSIRPTDAAGRWGGDEFLVVFAGTGDRPSGSRPGSADLVDRLRSALEEPIHFDGGSWVPAASIGVVKAEPGEDLDAVIRRADRSMFDEKRARNL